MASKFQHAFPLLFFFLMHNVQPDPSTIGYNCKATQYPCQTYVIFKTTSPNFVDLAAIGDLFGVSRLMIAKSNNFSLLNSTLLPHQPLLVPIKCSCNSLNRNLSISHAALNYTIRIGDNLYAVSTRYFQYLVTYQSVLAVNPTITDFVRIKAGKEVVFPIFCKCATSAQLRKRVKYLITYVFQPVDKLSDVALRYGSSEKLILEINGHNISSLDAIFIPVSRLPNITLAVVPPPPSVVVSERKGVILGLGVGAGISEFLLVFIFGIWCSKKLRQLKREGGLRIRVGDDHEKIKLMADVAGCLDKYRVFKIEELRKATNGFDDGLIIKGLVYKGCIDDEIYAIKKIKWDVCEELKILGKVNHGNLVRLEGFCIYPENSDCYVVYEYVENGSLYSWLHVEKKKRLSWNTRLRIAIDVANGLQYIHEHTRPKVVHKDIRSSNILLDSNMRAKIASFGLAKSGDSAITMHIVGIRGHIAPEYLTEGVVSTKMDVFSFGVVLLELISGGEVIDEEGKFLWARVDGILDGQEEGSLRKLREWMDGCLNEDSCTIESVMKVMVVAIACLHKDPTKRPNMEEVVYALSRNDDLVAFDMSEELHCPR